MLDAVVAVAGSAQLVRAAAGPGARGVPADPHERPDAARLGEAAAAHAPGRREVPRQLVFVARDGPEGRAAARGAVRPPVGAAAVRRTRVAAAGGPRGRHLPPAEHAELAADLSDAHDLDAVGVVDDIRVVGPVHELVQRRVYLRTWDVIDRVPS